MTLSYVPALHKQWNSEIPQRHGWRLLPPGTIET